MAELSKLWPHGLQSIKYVLSGSLERPAEVWNGSEAIWEGKGAEKALRKW